MSLPGGVGVSGLSVYDWPSADGLCGGSPHMHLLCTEAYAVVAGSGSLQTLTWADGLTETPLTTGSVVTFTPGTIHRLVNADGKLRILVIMANSGLPEAGDAVFTFPPHVLADPAAYRQAAMATSDTEAQVRRDLALKGFQRLRQQGHAELDEFHRRAASLVAPRLGEFERRWRAGALTAAEETGIHLSRLRRDDHSHLRQAAFTRLASSEALGMCGRLDRFDDR